MLKIKLPKGFLAGGIHCGIKKKRKDLSLFYSKKKCECAALFTRNMVKAAPVVLGQEQLMKARYFRAVVVNSGNANCMTGGRGLKDARRMASVAAKVLGVPANSVLVSSTGVIGKPMKMKPIVEGIPKLAASLSEDGLIHAAEGIMTTDRFYKVSSRSFVVGGKRITMVGVAKGAGMIKPDMATMLAYVLTDAGITKQALQKALISANEASFNSITVDGDMSTNDTVAVLANGEAGNKTIKGNSADHKVFKENLRAIMTDLAKMIVRDGEGATKLVEVNVSGAKTQKEARKAAEAIAGSLLTKCAVHGGDPNWGRVASSVGSSGIKLDPDRMDITLDGVAFLKKGKFTSPAAKMVRKVFKKKNVLIEVDLNRGKSGAVVYTCDISKKYVAINSYYTT